MRETGRSSLGIALTMLAAFGLMLAGCAAGTAGPGATATEGAAAKAAEGYKYVCACGTECPCGTNCDKPGNCACGKPMMYKKVLRDFGTTFGICPDPNCKLEAVSKEDPKKCACGLDLQIFPVKGRYACDCAGCDCNCTARQPGKCVCGKEMKQQW